MREDNKMTANTANEAETHMGNAIELMSRLHDPQYETVITEDSFMFVRKQPEVKE